MVSDLALRANAKTPLHPHHRSVHGCLGSFGIFRTEFLVQRLTASWSRLPKIVRVLLPLEPFPQFVARVRIVSFGWVVIGALWITGGLAVVRNGTGFNRSRA
jgi:hypothetical protein